MADRAKGGAKARVVVESGMADFQLSAGAVSFVVTGGVATVTGGTIKRAELVKLSRALAKWAADNPVVELREAVSLPRSLYLRLKEKADAAGISVEELLLGTANV